MCLLCDEAAALGGHGVAITERPAHRLHGLTWKGAHAQAASGAAQALIRRVKALSDSRAALWKSPIVVLSWDDGPKGPRCFAGIAPEEGEALPGGFTALDLPGMYFASSWHGPQDGDVSAHYGRMVEWLEGSGYRRDASHVHRREEYPHDADLEALPVLRLLLPIAKEGR